MRMIAAVPSVSPNARSGALYFAFYGAMASLLPFMVLYFERIGLSGGQIGVLSGLVPGMILLVGPLWSVLADATGRTRGMLLVASLGAAAFGVTVPLATTFWPLLALLGALAFFAAPLAALIDASVLAVLGASRDRYGTLRSWGAVGWGLSAPLVGLATESWGIAWAFLIFGALMALTAGVARSMPAAARPAEERPSFGAIIRMFADARWAPFLLAAFAGGIAMAGTSTFVYLRFAELGADETLVGLAITLATVSEVPVFVATAWLLRRWRAQTLLLVALGVFAVRLVLYGSLGSPLGIAVVQLLHGASFALMWTAGVHRAAELAPSGRAATGQGVFNSTVAGLGATVGSLLGGGLVDLFGTGGMFYVLAALVLVAGTPSAIRLVRTGGRQAEG